MNPSERDVKMAAKLYKCRDSAKSLYGEEYQKKLTTYKNFIQIHMKKNKLDVLPSMIEICGLDSVKNEAITQMLFMAAAVEMIEPSV